MKWNRGWAWTVAVMMLMVVGLTGCKNGSKPKVVVYVPVV